MAAADILEIVVHGRGGHGASPELVINPITVAAQIVVDLSNVMSDNPGALLSIGQFVSGTAFNIVPDVASMKGSLRTLHAREREDLLGRIAEQVKRRVAEHRARVVVRELGCCPALVNHTDQTALVHRCASAELGDAFVEPGSAVMASDDMALFLAQRPGCYFRVGCAPPGGSPPPHHSASFDIDEAGLLVGARVAASVLLAALAG